VVFDPAEEELVFAGFAAGDLGAGFAAVDFAAVDFAAGLAAVDFGADFAGDGFPADAFGAGLSAGDCDDGLAVDDLDPDDRDDFDGFGGIRRSSPWDHELPAPSRSPLSRGRGRRSASSRSP
jgi:hypothetical protein